MNKLIFQIKCELEILEEALITDQEYRLETIDQVLFNINEDVQELTKEIKNGK